MLFWLLFGLRSLANILKRFLLQSCGKHTALLPFRADATRNHCAWVWANVVPCVPCTILDDRVTCFKQFLGTVV